MRQDTTDTIPIPPLSLWLEHEEAHQAFYAELAQQPTRPRKPKPTLAGVARQQAQASLFHSFDHSELWLQIGGDVRTLDRFDSVEDAGPVEPVKRRKVRPTLARQAALPPMLPPRLICRDAAAAYVGVSPNTFDKMIADGLMPNPKRQTERRIAWDVRQLDTAIDRLPIDGEADTDTTDDHSWDDIDAQAKKKPVAH